MGKYGYGQGISSYIKFIPPDLPLACMDVGMGAIYIFAPGLRTSSPTFELAKQLLPIKGWGGLFIGVGVLLFIAMYNKRKTLATSLVRICAPAVFVMWAVIQLLNAVAEPAASMAGIPIFLYLAFRHTFAPVPPRTD